jgi:hypothetical protein
MGPELPGYFSSRFLHYSRNRRGRGLSVLRASANAIVMQAHRTAYRSIGEIPTNVAEP